LCAFKANALSDYYRTFSVVPIKSAAKIWEPKSAWQGTLSR